MRGKIGTWGNSAAVRLPQGVMDSFGWKRGEEIELVEVAEGVLLRRANRPRYHYTLQELVAQMERCEQPEFVDWGADVGAEVVEWEADEADK